MTRSDRPKHVEKITPNNRSSTRFPCSLFGASALHTAENGFTQPPLAAHCAVPTTFTDNRRNRLSVAQCGLRQRQCQRKSRTESRTFWPEVLKTPRHPRAFCLTRGWRRRARKRRLASWTQGLGGAQDCVAYVVRVAASAGVISVETFFEISGIGKMLSRARARRSRDAHLDALTETAVNYGVMIVFQDAQLAP